MKRNLSLFLLVLLIAANACRITRPPVVTAPVTDKPADSLVLLMKQNQLVFTYLSASLNAGYTNASGSMSFSGQLRMRSDSIIWVSITPALGIEMARLVITRDSVRFVNRLERTYYAGDYSFINSRLKANVDYDMLQALLTGNDVKYYDDGAFTASYSADAYILTATNRKKIAFGTGNIIGFQKTSLNPAGFKIIEMLLSDRAAADRAIEATYLHQEASGQLAPQQIDFRTLSPESPVQITLKYSKLSFPATLTFPFSVSDSYKKL